MFTSPPTALCTRSTSLADDCNGKRPPEMRVHTWAHLPMKTGSFTRLAENFSLLSTQMEENDGELNILICLPHRPLRMDSSMLVTSTGIFTPSTRKPAP